MTLDKIGPRFAVAFWLCLWMVGDAAAVQVTLNLVQAQSTIMFRGDFLGTMSNPANPTSPQDDPMFPTAGTIDGDPTRPSNVTTLTGTITVDVDNVMAPATIQILSAEIDGTVNGSWLPEPQPEMEGLASDNPPDPATPADLAFKLVSFGCCDAAFGVIRDFADNLVTEIPDPDDDGPLTATPVVEPVNAQGEFSSLSQNLTYLRGYFDFWVDPFTQDVRQRVDFTGDNALNQHVHDNDADTDTPISNAPKSTYIVSGDLVTLTIPVDIDIDDFGDFSQYFDGQFVATFEIGALPGDHNGDGHVNAADFPVWRKNPGGFGGQQGYDDWRNNFGEPGSGAGLGASGAVPEPAAAALALLGLIGWWCGRSAGR